MTAQPTEARDLPVHVARHERRLGRSSPRLLCLARELEDAALVDGLTPIGAFLRILLRLSVPGVATAGIPSFVCRSSWWRCWRRSTSSPG